MIAVENVALLSRALDGDRRAALELVRRLTPTLRARVRRFLARLGPRRASRFDLEDLVQDIWCDILKGQAAALRSFNPERNPSLDYFVLMLADRRLSHIYDAEFRTEKRRVAREAVAMADADVYASSGADPAEGLEDKELRSTLDQYLAERLPDQGLVICRMLYADHASPERIALALGVSKQVVYNWQHKIRVLAREFLG
ncbi:MAG: sigma-70 family RNA polymerase sigma factor [Myxococcota bacterium]